VNDVVIASRSLGHAGRTVRRRPAVGNALAAT
jgi:hypothetical protein